MNIFEQEWFVVGPPWRDRSVETYIVAGNPDPHGGVMVCDMPPAYMQVENEEFETEEEAMAHSDAIAQHICDLHNAALKSAASPTASSGGRTDG